VQSIAINDAAPVQIQRDRLGRITDEQLSARFLRTRGYDEEGRLTTQRIESPLVHIDRAYSYDLTGNLIEKQDSAKGTHKFGYDPMGRITAALDPMKQVHRFSYDPAGDLLNHLPENQSDLRRATYQGGAYHFDAAGNLTRRQLNGATLDLSWDEQNRLRAVEGPDTQPVTMGYDALGRRCHKTVGDQQTLFVWDGDALIAESINHNKAREYVYYPGTFEPFAVIDADKQLYYYHNDINGLPQELTCPEGRIVWSARYDALGRLQGLRVDEVAQPLRLQGQYWDQEIGLCYNRYRYFDPHICSFISQDPIGLAGGDNVYAYGPNVWGWVDPLGLCPKMAPPKKLPNELAATFEGGNSSRVLNEDLILYRGGTENQPLGQFFSKDAPISEIQARVDKAILPEWPGGGKSPIDTAFQVKIPKGTTIHTGKVASQGGFYVGCLKVKAVRDIQNLAIKE
jgi:RHS repeat-associated protein